MSEKKQSELLEETKETIRKETNIISESVTRILMLGGPRFVQAILSSLLDTNEKIMKSLKMKTEIEFNGGDGK